MTEVISGHPGLYLNLVGTANIYLMLVVAHLLGRFYWEIRGKTQLGSVTLFLLTDFYASCVRIQPLRLSQPNNVLRAFS